jgi:HK97 family phage major capsid protein
MSHTGLLPGIPLLGQLEERRAANVAASRQILDLAKATGRDLTAEEAARFDTLSAETKEIDVRIGTLREEAAREHRAAAARAGGPSESFFGGRADALAVRSENRLQPGQTMRQYMARRIADTRMSRGAAPDREFNAGAYFRGMVTGRWEDDGRDAYERRALAEGSGSTGGYLVPIDLSATLIDIVRNSARVLQAGATVVPLSHLVTNVAALTADPTPAWRAEGASISATGGTFAQKTFTTQTLAAVTVVSRELLEDVPTLGDEVTRELALEMALALDLAALYGSGHDSDEPPGVKNATWSVSQTSMGDDGAAPSTLTPTPWALLTAPCYRLLEANEAGLSGAIMAPRTEQDLINTVSTIGTYVSPPDRMASIARYGTAPLEVYNTNQVPVNLTQGDADTATDLFVGDWSQLLVGIRTSLDIKVLQEAYAGTGQIGFLAWMRADVVVARASAFDITVGILANS